MTNEEAIAIMRKEYLCVDRDCDIERSCGKCDLMMPTKEPILDAYKMAIKALETIPKYKDAYGKGWDDGAKATYEHLKMCEEEQEPKTGHWKRISMDKYSEHAKYWYRCDRCGKDNLGNTDWCPNCGTRMVEPQESEDKE